MPHWIHSLPFAGFDLETTDLDPTCARPVSGAIVRHTPDHWAALPGFPLLIHPGIDALPIPEATVAIHGITTRQAAEEGVDLLEALERLNQGLLEACAAGWPLVAANARYDLTILDHNSRRNGVASLHQRARAEGVPVTVVDPLLLDRWWDRYRPERRGTAQLCPRYGVGGYKAHDALMDAVTAAELARAVLWAALEEPDEDEWRRARAAEIRACTSLVGLHDLQEEWNARHSEALQARKRRWNPRFTAPPEWPVLAFVR